jgi:hypothetical protein
MPRNWQSNGGSKSVEVLKVLEVLKVSAGSGLLATFRTSRCFRTFTNFRFLPPPYNCKYNKETI